MKHQTVSVDRINVPRSKFWFTEAQSSLPFIGAGPSEPPPFTKAGL